MQELEGLPDKTGSDSVRRTLNEALGDECTPTGSSVSYVLHDVFLSEARQQGSEKAVEAWSGLDVATIAVLRDWILGLFAGTGLMDRVLPAGSVAGSIVWPSFFVGAECFGFDVDRPGLQSLQHLPEMPAGSNLKLLLSRIHERCRLRPCHAIGTPILVTRHDAGAASYRLQFPAFEHAGGAVLQRTLDYAAGGLYFCALSPTEIDEIAADIVTDMVNLWNNNVAVARRVFVARDAARRVTARIHGAELRAIAVEPRTQTDMRALGLVVEFDALDDALRPGVVCQHVLPDEEPSDAISSLGLMRSVMLDLMKRSGMNGMMHGVARAVAIASREGLEELLADLGRKLEVFATLDGPQGPVTFRLFWSDGVVHVQSCGSQPVDVYYDRVVILNRHLPETTLAILRGRALRDVVAEPFGCDTPISRAENIGRNIHIELMHDPWLINTDLGVTCRRHDI